MESFYKMAINTVHPILTKYAILTQIDVGVLPTSIYDGSHSGCFRNLIVQATAHSNMFEYQGSNYHVFFYPQMLFLTAKNSITSKSVPQYYIFYLRPFFPPTQAMHAGGYRLNWAYINKTQDVKVMEDKDDLQNMWTETNCHKIFMSRYI